MVRFGSRTPGAEFPSLTIVRPAFMVALMRYGIHLLNVVILCLSVGSLMFFGLMFIRSVMGTLPGNNQQ